MEKKEFEKRVDEVTTKLADTLKRKNADYGNSFETLFKRIGMSYAYGHMAEKLERIWTLTNNDAKVNESIGDSLLDLAGYALLTYIHICENKNAKIEERQSEPFDGFKVNDIIVSEDRPHIPFKVLCIAKYYMTVSNDNETIIVTCSDATKWHHGYNLYNPK